MRHEAVEEVEIMDEVPQVIRKSISLQINLPLFEKLGIFHDFPLSLQTAIAGMMYPLQVRRSRVSLKSSRIVHDVPSAGTPL